MRRRDVFSRIYQFMGVGTPQTQPARGYEEQQKRNLAGGYSFLVAEEFRLRRFLLLGTEAGSYYQSPEALTRDNVAFVSEMIKRNSATVLEIVRDHIKRRWYLRPYAIFFTLVLLTEAAEPEVRKGAWDALLEVATTPFNLFRILGYIRAVRGTGRSVRKFIQRWYLSREADKLAYQLFKYRQRDGWSHRDALLIGHVKAEDEKVNAILRNIVEVNKGNRKLTEIDEGLSRFTDGLRELYRAINVKENEEYFTSDNDASAEKIAKIVAEYRLTWDVVPTEYLNSPVLWKTLIDNGLLPVEAGLRQVGRLTKLDIKRKYVDAVLDKVEKNLERFRFYQIFYAYLALRNGDKKVRKRLEKWLASYFEKVSGTDKYRLLVAVDSSGSMTWGTNVGTKEGTVSAYHYALVFAGYLAARYGADFLEFDTQLHRIGKAPKNLGEALERNPDGGGTDVALPFKYALGKRKYYDAIVVFTDSETWAGWSHPIEVIDAYRKKVNPNLLAVNVPLVANESSFVPDHPFSLELAGPVPEIDRIVFGYLDTIREKTKSNAKK